MTVNLIPKQIFYKSFNNNFVGPAVSYELPVGLLDDKRVIFWLQNENLNMETNTDNFDIFYQNYDIRCDDTVIDSYVNTFKKEINDILVKEIVKFRRELTERYRYKRCRNN